MKDLRIIFGILLLWFFFCFCVFCLAGCSRKTPVDNAFQEVSTSIVALKEELPVECKTDVIIKKVEDLELKNQFAEQICKSKIKDTELKYERALWVLGFIILGFFAKIFIKK